MAALCWVHLFSPVIGSSHGRRTSSSGTVVKIGQESIIWLTERCSGPQFDIPLGLFATGWRVTGRCQSEVVLTGCDRRAFSRRLLLSVCKHSRICDRGASDFGKRRERMNLAASRTHDVFGANSAN